MNDRLQDKYAAVLCASGIGDALLMAIVAHHLKTIGYTPVIFHHLAKTIAPLFQHAYQIKQYPDITSLKETLQPFSIIIVENDHSKYAYKIFQLRTHNSLPPTRIIFPTPSHAITSTDFLCDPKHPFATNLSHACQKFFQTNSNKSNDILIPKNTTYKKYNTRIIIHPTSKDPKRNWAQHQFISLAKKLKKHGKEPVFCMHYNEIPHWNNQEFQTPIFKNLLELMTYIYESAFFIGNDSGIGHLASNIGIPTLTISGSIKRVRLWKPDWSPSHVITPKIPLPNFKGFRIRHNHWQPFISAHRVFQMYKRLTT